MQNIVEQGKQKILLFTLLHFILVIATPLLDYQNSLTLDSVDLVY